MRRGRTGQKVAETKLFKPRWPSQFCLHITSVPLVLVKDAFGELLEEMPHARSRILARNISCHLRGPPYCPWLGWVASSSHCLLSTWNPGSLSQARSRLPLTLPVTRLPTPGEAQLLSQAAARGKARTPGQGTSRSRGVAHGRF